MEGTEQGLRTGGKDGGRGARREDREQGWMTGSKERGRSKDG